MRRGLLVIIAFAAFIAAVGLSLQARLRREAGEAPPRRPRAIRFSLPERSPLAGPRVVVIHKGERALGLYLDEQLAATHPVGLGRSPESHKEREGDGRTPEGRYYVCNRNPRSRFHLFLGISYPNADDAEAALRAGRISEQEHRAIVEAIRAGRKPPWDTPLGGEIGMHGGGPHSDWTLGCIAMENEAVEDLWKALKIGDPVLIRP